MTTYSYGDAAPGCGDPARELLDFYLNGSLEGDEDVGLTLIVLPAAGLAPGPCEIIQKVESAGGESRICTYPLEVERAGPRS